MNRRDPHDHPLRRPGEPPERAPLTRLARGFRGRTLPTARLASSLGLGQLRRVLASPDPLRAIDEEEAVRAAQLLLERLDGLKGLVMKFGQMASYLSPSLPPKAQRILARLQSESRPLAYATIAGVVEEEMGQPPDALFDRFDHQPFAAASIGQVHRARLGGRELAVKVQYPGIAALLEADLATIGRLARLFLALAPFSAGALLEELAERVRQECDYLAEAENQRLFSRLLDGPEAAVPAVLPERCSRRVLTSAFAEGESFYPFCAGADQARKNQAAATILRSAFTGIFSHCVINADPHPGNYLFTRDGRVIFLDFGCVKRFDPDFIERWKLLARTVLDGDRQGFPRALEATGLVARPRRFDFDYHWQVMEYLYQPYISTRFTFTQEYVRRSYDLTLFKNPNRQSTGLPRDWLFVNRLQWGLNAVLAALGATGPFTEIFRQAVESPTTPAG